MPASDLFDGAPPPASPGLSDPPGETPHHLGHRQRLRTRFLDAGPDALADYELLELLLFGAIPQGDVKPLAKRLIAHFGGFAEVMAAEPRELMAVPGVKQATATLIKVVCAAARHMARERVLGKPALSNWQALLDYCRTALADAKIEEFRLLFLDRKNVLIADEAQQRGTVDHTPVYPREVVKRALELNASALILVHNHPSGDPTPSKNDIDMTVEIQRAAAAVGVIVHDHLVIGRKGHCSFKSLGLL